MDTAAVGGGRHVRRKITEGHVRRPSVMDRLREHRAHACDCTAPGFPEKRSGVCGRRPSRTRAAPPRYDSPSRWRSRRGRRSGYLGTRPASAAALARFRHSRAVLRSRPTRSAAGTILCAAAYSRTATRPSSVSPCASTSHKSPVHTTAFAVEPGRSLPPSRVSFVLRSTERDGHAPSLPVRSSNQFMSSVTLPSPRRVLLPALASAQTITLAPPVGQVSRGHDANGPLGVYD